MAWFEFNPNPEGSKTTDCTVRALCKALDSEWDPVYLSLCAIGFQIKRMPSNNETWGALLRRNGFKRYALPNNCPDCYTAADFCRDHPDGLYVLIFDSHLATVENGDLYDAWNSEQEIPQFYWVKED